MLSAADIIIYISGLIVLVLWLFFYIKGKKEADYFSSLDEKEYPLKDIYFLGFAVLETIKYSYKSKSDRKLRKELSVLYSEKYADYYMRVIYSQKITIAFTVLTLAVPFYGFSSEPAILLVFMLLSGAAYYYFGTLTAKKILSRSEEMLSDFSQVVSKLALMTNAGMILHEAWEEAAFSGEGALYKEMQTSLNEMKNGISEIDAFYNFGSRCIIPEIKKFSSTVVQGLVKGNSELSAMLQEQSKEVWEAKQQNTRRLGEKAASKLLLPSVLIFIGILIIIMVPIVTNLGI